MANKYLALKGEDKFDINKITVVGNPIITNNGILTHQSEVTNNYVYHNFGYEPTNFKVIFPVQFLEIDTHHFGQGVARVFGWRVCYNYQEVRIFDGANEPLIIVPSNPTLGNYIVQHIPVYFSIEKTDDTMTAGWSIDKINWTSLSSSLENATLPTTRLTEIDLGSDLYWSFKTPVTIDLKEVLVTGDNQLVFQPVKPTYLLERRKPTVWNKGQFDVIGSPSISDDGVASGFSTNDYVTLGSDIINKLVNATNFNFTFRFKTGNSLGSGGLVLGHNNAISGGTFSLWVSASSVAPIVFLNESGTATLKAIGNLTKTINTNTEYEAYFRKEGNNYGFGIRAITESDFTQSAGITSTETIYANTQTIGRNTILNSIDLKQFKIYTDNNLVFDGGAETYVYDPSKFTVVGSPTITEYGVASGFSGSDYLTVNTTGFFNNNYNFEIDSKVKYTSDTTAEQEIWDFSWIFRCRIWYTNNKHRLDFYMPYGSNYTNTSVYLEDYGFVDGDDLYIKCISENASSRKLMFSKDGINWNTITNTNTTDKDITSYNLLKIGQYSTTVYWLTNIDLSQFSITVDSKEVFTGAKENFYMLRR